VPGIWIVAWVLSIQDGFGNEVRGRETGICILLRLWCSAVSWAVWAEEEKIWVSKWAPFEMADCLVQMGRKDGMGRV